MSKIESSSKTLIGQMATKGQKLILTTREKHLLSIWGTKTVYVMCKLKSGSLNIPVEHYRFFYQNMTPPPGTAIFVAFRKNAIQPENRQFGGFKITQLKKVHIKNPSNLPFLEQQKNQGKHFYAAILVVGHLAFILVGHNFVETDLLGKFPMDYLQMIWPIDDSNIIWPNTKPVDNIGGWDGLYKNFCENIFIEKYDPNNSVLVPF